MGWGPQQDGPPCTHLRTLLTSVSQLICAGTNSQVSHLLGQAKQLEKVGFAVESCGVPWHRDREGYILSAEVHMLEVRALPQGDLVQLGWRPRQHCLTQGSTRVWGTGGWHLAPT